MENKQIINPPLIEPQGKDHYFVFIIVLICSIIFNMFFFQLAVVKGDSMYPTLKNGQLLIVNKIASTDTYERGDILICDVNGTKIIKRLIALPNETIQIIDNDIYINNEKIPDFIDVQMEDYGYLSSPLTLQEDEYVLMGDNRNNSLDSRSFGQVKEQNIIGKVVFRFLPLSTTF